MRKCSRLGGWRELPLLLACVATVSAAMGEPIAAGYRDLVNVSVDEGQAVTQDDWVWRAAEAVIYKVGAGSLTFTPSAVLDSSAFGIGIRDGNVTFAVGLEHRPPVDGRHAELRPFQWNDLRVGMARRS